MGQFSRLLRFFAAAAAFALLLAAPLGALAHEHPDQADSQCLICKVSGSETAVFHDGPALPAPPGDAGFHADGVQPVPDAPAADPGAPRAPPS